MIMAETNGLVPILIYNDDGFALYIDYEGSNIYIDRLLINKMEHIKVDEL